MFIVRPQSAQHPVVLARWSDIPIPDRCVDPAHNKLELDSLSDGRSWLQAV